MSNCPARELGERVGTGAFGAGAWAMEIALNKKTKAVLAEFIESPGMIKRFELRSSTARERGRPPRIAGRRPEWNEV
jgi:hypothetical protein